jgi:excisionase family DNA binding protein
MEHRLIDINAASEYLDIKKTTLRCWCSMKIIPYVKFGRMVRFDISQLDSWIKENLKTPENFDNILESSRGKLQAKIYDKKP